MVSDDGIPCSSCKLWKKQLKKFSCDPNRCEALSEWLLEAKNQIKFQIRQREYQYVV